MKYIFPLLILFAFSATISAQVSELDSVESSRVVTLSHHSGNFQINSSGYNDNVVKIGVLDFVSGYIPVYYERSLFPWLSVQVGVGVTARDFIADGVNLIFVPEPDYSPYYDYSKRKPAAGCYLSVQPKFYTNSNAPEGFWISPMLEYKLFNFYANEVNSSGPSAYGDPVYLPNVYFHEHRTDIDFTINIGGQWLLDERKVSLEISWGAGFRRFWEHRIDIAYNQVGSNGVWINGARDFNGWRPDFIVDFRIGGYF